MRAIFAAFLLTLTYKHVSGFNPSLHASAHLQAAHLSKSALRASAPRDAHIRKRDRLSKAMKAAAPALLFSPKAALAAASTAVSYIYTYFTRYDIIIYLYIYYNIISY